MEGNDRPNPKLNELLQSYAVIDNKVDLSKVLKEEYRR
jgi:hypothetical protein